MYRDSNGNEFESYEDACYYYGVDTPAQQAAEDAYWTEEENRELALLEDNEALIFDVHSAAYILEWTARDQERATWTEQERFDDECPF